MLYSKQQRDKQAVAAAQTPPPPPEPPKWSVKNPVTGGETDYDTSDAARYEAGRLYRLYKGKGGKTPTVTPRYTELEPYRKSDGSYDVIKYLQDYNQAPDPKKLKVLEYAGYNPKDVDNAIRDIKTPWVIKDPITGEERRFTTEVEAQAAGTVWTVEDPRTELEHKFRTQAEANQFASGLIVDPWVRAFPQYDTSTGVARETGKWVVGHPATGDLTVFDTEKEAQKQALRWSAQYLSPHQATSSSSTIEWRTDPSSGRIVAVLPGSTESRNWLAPSQGDLERAGVINADTGQLANPVSSITVQFFVNPDTQEVEFYRAGSPEAEARNSAGWSEPGAVSPVSAQNTQYLVNPATGQVNAFAAGGAEASRRVQSGWKSATQAEVSEATGIGLSEAPKQYLVNPANGQVTEFVSGGAAAKQRVKEGWSAPVGQTKLPDGAWVKDSDLEKIKSESPELYQVLTTEGYDAYQKRAIEVGMNESEALSKSVDANESLTRQEQAEFDRIMSRYKEGDKYRLADALTDKVDVGLLVRGFGMQAVYDTLQAIQEGKAGEAAQRRLERDYVKLSNGEWIPKADYPNLTEGDLAFINEFGIAEFNRASTESNKLLTIQSERGTVKLATGERIPDADYRGMSTEDKALINEIGVAAFNADVERRNDAALGQRATAKEQTAILNDLESQGFVSGGEYDLVGAIDAGVSESRLAAVFGQTAVTAAKDFLTNNVKLGDGQYIPKWSKRGAGGEVMEPGLSEIEQQSPKLAADLKALGYTPTFGEMERLKQSDPKAYFGMLQKYDMVPAESVFVAASPDGEIRYTVPDTSPAATEKRWENVRTGKTITEAEHAALGYSAERDEYRLTNKAAAERLVEAGKSSGEFALSLVPGVWTKDLNLGKPNQMAAWQIGVNVGLDLLTLIPVAGWAARTSGKAILKAGTSSIAKSLSKELPKALVKAGEKGLAAESRVIGKTIPNIDKLTTALERAASETVKAERSGNIDRFMQAVKSESLAQSELSKAVRKLGMDIAILNSKLPSVGIKALPKDGIAKAIGMGKSADDFAKYIAETQKEITRQGLSRSLSRKVGSVLTNQVRAYTDTPRLVADASKAGVKSLRGGTKAGAAYLSGEGRVASFSPSKKTAAAISEAYARGDTNAVREQLTNIQKDLAKESAKARARAAQFKGNLNALDKWDEYIRETWSPGGRPGRVIPSPSGPGRFIPGQERTSPRVGSGGRGGGTATAELSTRTMTPEQLTRLGGGASRTYQFSLRTLAGTRLFTVVVNQDTGQVEVFQTPESAAMPQIITVEDGEWPLIGPSYTPAVRPAFETRTAPVVEPSTEPAIPDRRKSFEIHFINQPRALRFPTVAPLLGVVQTVAGKGSTASVGQQTIGASRSSRSSTRASAAVVPSQDTSAVVRATTSAAVKPSTGTSVKTSTAAVTKTASSTATATSAATQTKAATQTQSATSPATGTQTKAATSTSTRTPTSPITRTPLAPVTAPATATVPATNTVPATAPATKTSPALKAALGIPVRTPVRPPMRPPVMLPPELEGGEGEGAVSVPIGSVAWKQGYTWKYIPAPWNGLKPVSLRRGETPRGARLNGRTPAETIQVVGKPKSRVPRTASIDLGIADVYISDYGRHIEFAGKGEDTDVGLSLDDTTIGMSVPGVGRVRQSKRTKSKKRQPARRYTQNPDMQFGVSSVRTPTARAI